MAYLIATMTVSVQITREMPPSTFSWVRGTPPWPRKIWSKAYSGEVPMSPYTIPAAAIVNAATLPWGAWEAGLSWV